MNTSIRRTGMALSITGLILALVYLGALAGVGAAGSMPPAEPLASVIAVVSLLSAPLFVCLWAVLHQAMPAERQGFTQASLALMTIFAALTSINRYVSLTVVPQAQALGAAQGLEWFLPYGWPSIMAAIEILAWGFFLGLAFLALAPAFQIGRLERALSWTLIVSGVFCLIGTLGQVLNSVPLNLLGIPGWGLGLMVVLGMLAAWFRSSGN